MAGCEGACFQSSSARSPYSILQRSATTTLVSSIETTSFPNRRPSIFSDRFTEVSNTKDIAIFKNPSALPRAWMVSAAGLETFSTFEEELRRLKGEAFDPVHSATVSEQQLRPRGPDTGTSQAFTAPPTI